MAKHKGDDDDKGTDDFSNVGEDNGNGEHRGHEDGNEDTSVHRFGIVDANAVDPAHPGQMYFGTGNLATGYNIVDNAEEHVEVGLKVHLRGPAVDQTPTFDSHGNPTYTEPAGAPIAAAGDGKGN